MTTKKSGASQKFYNRLDTMPWVDMSYVDWDVSAKRREAFLSQRREFGVSDFDRYNVADATAGLLANTLILAARNEILPTEDFWEKTKGDVPTVKGIENAVYDSVRVLSNFAANSEATHEHYGEDNVAEAFRIAFAILPTLKCPDAAQYEIPEDRMIAYRETRCVRMVSQLDIENLGYKVIHMISTLLMNLANNTISTPLEFVNEDGDKWGDLLREASFNFTRREFMPDNSIPEEAQKFFIDYLGNLWD